MDKKELISQTKLAFDFIQKLYLEVSYLVKEVEGLLGEENEKFVFCRSGGYSIITRSSSGLEPYNVSLWPLRKFSVMFVPESNTETGRGQTKTRLDNNLRVIYMRIVMDDKGLPEPSVYMGVLKDFVKKGNKWPVKVEQLIAHIEYHENQVFAKGNEIDFEDVNVAFKGKLFQTNLYDLNSSQDVAEKLVKPALKFFREA